MDIAERYLAYADAFEATYEDDDRSRIEPDFAGGSGGEGREGREGREGGAA